MQGRGPLFPFQGKMPAIHPEAWIAPTAAIIGDVEIGKGSGIWFNCVVRGDVHQVRIGERSNIQDGSILHVARGKYPCIVGNDVTVGHMAIVHACVLEDKAFVGMGAIVLDGAVIESEGMLAAGAVLSPGKRIARGELWGGIPAKPIRVLSPEERAQWAKTAVNYAELGGNYRLEYARQAMAGAAG